MEQILAETSQFTQYRGGLGYLYLDGKLLELLSIYLGEVLELDILMGKNISMSRTEKNCHYGAKRIIDSQLAFAPLVRRTFSVGSPKCYKIDTMFSHRSMVCRFINTLLNSVLVQAAQLLFGKVTGNVSEGLLRFVGLWEKPK